MRSLFIAQIVAFFTYLSGCASLVEKIKVSYDLPKADSYWVERNPPTAPLNAAESLAVKSAAGLMTLQLPKESASYEGHDASFTLVRHEQQSMGEESHLISVKYRIRNGLVYGETVPAYVARHDQQKEQIAQEVARKSINGREGAIPTVYNGRMFVVKKGSLNSCTIDVVEKDLNREYATYRVKAC